MRYLSKVKLLLRQHVGGPDKPIVEVGQKVKRGELIAVPEGLGANIHSSVDGVVTEINEAIVIEADDVQSDDFVKLKESESKLDMIKEAGIVGAGGAGFPTGIKLSTELPGGYVIVNAAECEPILSHNIEFIDNFADVLIRGIEYTLEVCKAEKAYIAIKPKHKKTMITIARLIKDKKNIEIKYLPDMYPAGDERVIVRELLGVILEPGQLPCVANAVIVNVETVKNIARAIDERRPVITKDITVGGKINGNIDGTVFLDVPIGASVSTYIEKAGGLAQGSGEIVIGGPFTGKSGSPDTPITKTTGGILVAIDFPHFEKKFGVLECECGAQLDRLTEIVEKMGGTVVASQKCKRMKEVNGRYRCEQPGECPGQAETVLKLKSAGAEAILTGT